MAQKYNNRFVRWLDERFPIFTAAHHQMYEYPMPVNLNYWWSFGSLAGITLVVMIFSGIFLAMQYQANVEQAFDSVERITRDVNYGWLVRNIHQTGSSMFFAIVYIHIFRGFYYGSYKRPREITWITGVVIFLVMMATAFMGYVLVWGQQSFWAATVITNLFSAFPLVGESITTWLWGGYAVDNPTLNRFYALHYLLPFIIFALVATHLIALHTTRSNNPLGIDMKGPQDVIPFHPYYTVKDLVGVGVFASIFAALVFFAPDLLTEPDNFIPADPLVTPAHIVPEWYFLPYYAILRAVPDLWLVSAKLAGVIAMFGATMIWLFVPWLDRSPVRSARFRPVYRVFFWLLVFACVVLGFCGARPPEGIYLIISRIATAWYFAHFLIFLPLIGLIEKPRALPQSIIDPVLPRSDHFAREPDVLHARRRAVGAGVLLIVTGLTAAAFAPTPARAESTVSVDIPVLEHKLWTFKGPFGSFDQAQLRRGLQVYNEACAACHSLRHVAYRNLSALGVGFGPEDIVAFAAEYQVEDGPGEDGKMYMRPARPGDYFAPPYPNKEAARVANKGMYPPDLSLMTRAREDGANFLYEFLIGYEDPPPGFQKTPGMYFNRTAPGQQTGMMPALADDYVDYDDGTRATVEQMAQDVTAFFAWAADPHMETRKELGLKVVIFLVLLTFMLIALKLEVWAPVHQRIHADQGSGVPKGTGSEAQNTS
jgi:ubiquinol-cytochrome c reductase cytochrome b/c1 subunit